MFKGRWRVASVVASLCVAASVHAQSSLYGVIETYFYSSRSNHGISQTSSWAEINYRANPKLQFTLSGSEYKQYHSWDELYGAVDIKDSTLIVGRFRTAFGFSTWADSLYSGLNHLPLVRTYALSNGTSLFRDDSGVEYTTRQGNVQMQAAIIDKRLSSTQVVPNDVNTGSLRLEMPYKDFIVGVDALRRFSREEGIYGVDVRYTAPHWLARVEAYTGTGEDSGSGYYAELKYRVPKLSRTQLLAVTEMVGDNARIRPIYLHTLGVRQIFYRYFTLNLNYGWGTGLGQYDYLRSQGSDNFSALVMFQFQF